MSLLGRLTTKSPLINEKTLMSVERLELSTNGLKGRCSAIELHARVRSAFYHAPREASIRLFRYSRETEKEIEAPTYSENRHSSR